ncbi:hypothetical protein MMC12_001680 [Toensbergia leucococca]|nr:hypothetical protein [Toensbergia leucococca]
MCNIFGKIEELGYEADASQNDDRAQWIYQRAIRALDHCTNYPDDRRRSLLLKIARFYQRLDSHLEAEHVLEKVAKIRNMSINVTSSEKEFRDVRSSSIEQISRALIAAFAELPKHELPPALSSDPSPSLHRALQHDSPKLVSALLVAGRGPLPPCDIMDQTILHVAAQNGHADLLEQIIRKYPSININCRDLCQRTPLFLAASNGHDRVCKLLLNLHADKDARNLASHTVFEVAARNGHLGVVRLLCDRQANVNPLPFDGTSTPLQAAAESGHIDIVRVLLATGKIDLSLKRLPDQKTAKDLACDRGFTEISNLLTSTSRSTRCETNEFFGTHSFRY